MSFITAASTTAHAKLAETESSWETMEYAGLPDWTAVKNTFIDCPAERSVSLEEFMKMNEQKCKSCPNSGVMMHRASKLPQSAAIPEESEGSTADDGSTTDESVARSEETGEEDSWEKITYGELPEWTAVKNTFIDCPAERSISLEEFIQLNQQKCKSCPSSGVMMHPSSKPPQSFTIFEDEPKNCSFVAAAGRGGQETPAVSADEDIFVLKLAPMLTQLEPIFSMGSHAHFSGQCKPCGFLHKPDGCAKGASCPFCHLCPKEAIKERKQMKKSVMKMQRRGFFTQQRQRMWMGY